ncbi:MAG: DUF3500 domain-containing protein [Planctomycetota bacterium]|nr:DUF3500 domain-containing protein [Planctomycetota bacterium]
MTTTKLKIVLMVVGLGALTAFGLQKAERPAGESMVSAAQAFAGTLTEEQTKITVLPYADASRVDWHFIPKAERKGLMVREMNAEQKKAAQELLKTGLSVMGHRKIKKIIALEGVLHELEKANPGKFARDTKRYYYTLFGEPGEKGKWGLSIEGHHLSLNFVVDDSKVISSTPQVLCANPTIVQDDLANVKKGTRVLEKEEVLAFELVNSLEAKQLEVALIAETAPREVRSAGMAQVPAAETVGIPFHELNDQQQSDLRKLLRVYSGTMAPAIAQQRLNAIGEAGWRNVRFAWAGSTKPGIGHYYRIHGPTFEVEFVNTQPDAAGNPASHIHCMWRDVRGDFALPAR